MSLYPPFHSSIVVVVVVVVVGVVEHLFTQWFKIHAIQNRKSKKDIFSKDFPALFVSQKQHTYLKGDKNVSGTTEII